MSQFLGTIPAEHRGGSAGTGNPSRCPLLPSSQLPGFLCELGAVCSAAFLEAAGPPAKHISAAPGWLEDSGTRGDVFEENTLPRIRSGLRAVLCHTGGAGKRRIPDGTGSSCGSGFIRNWGEVTNAAEAVPFAAKVAAGAPAELLKTTGARIPSYSGRAALAAAGVSLHHTNHSSQSSSGAIRAFAGL